MKGLRLPTILFVIAAFAACAPPAPRESTEIAARSEQWQAAFNARDTKALAALYTEDCRLLAPNAPLGQGHTFVKETFTGMIKAGLSGEMESIEAMAVGDLGYNVGSYKLLAADGAEADRGKFIEIWRKVDGEWKISNDMFNSDLPATADPHAGHDHP